MKKLWPFEDNNTKSKCKNFAPAKSKRENFATPNATCKIFATPSTTCEIFASPFPLAKISQLLFHLRNFGNSIFDLRNLHVNLQIFAHQLSYIFSQDILCNYLFPPCNQLKIFMGYLGYLKGG